MDQYIKGSLLGKGTFGVVIKATHKEVVQHTDGALSISLILLLCLTQISLVMTDWQSCGHQEDWAWQSKGRRQCDSFEGDQASERAAWAAHCAVTRRLSSQAKPESGRLLVGCSHDSRWLVLCCISALHHTDSTSKPQALSEYVYVLV